jgi:hypothetical protein
MYFSIADVAFTPTHIAILMDGGELYLHPHSVYYQGFAYITATKKYRLDALVKRRWCAKTANPKVS